MGPNPTSEYFNGNGNTMTYSVPAGLTITSYSLKLYAFAGPCTIQSGQCANGFGDVFVNHTGQSDPNYDYRNLGNGAANTTVGASSLSGVNNLTIGVGCDPGQNLSYPCSGSADPEAQALVSSGSITLHDATIPTVTNVSGSLIAGGTLTGTNTINFTAADSGSGIYSATALIDGHPATQQIPNTNGGTCVNLTPTSTTMTFPAPQPCPAAENFSLSLNTTQFSAGQHHLQVIVKDAAGDTAVAFDGSIVTSGPPVVGVNGGGIVGRGAPNGEPCAGEALEVAVNGERTPPVVQYGKPVTIRGVLHCGTVPIRNARVTIETVGAPAGAAVATSVQTALDGSFTYKLPRGPSRTLRFSYTAYSNDPGPSATATVTVAIRPKIHLRIKPNRTRNGQKIHWTGTISGGPFPRQGVTLDIEVKEGRHWKFFNQTLAGRKGHFHFKYRFHATTEPTTYTFRVALPNTGAHGYPYVHGASNTVNVHVNP